MNERLLPNYYKKIGFITGILCITIFIFKHPIGDYIPLEQARLNWIIKDLILAALLIISFSRDKNETVKVKNLRLQELKGAVIFGGFLLFVDSIPQIIFWHGHHEIKDGFEIMIAISLYYLISFNIRKYK